MAKAYAATVPYDPAVRQQRLKEEAAAGVKTCGPCGEVKELKEFHKKLQKHSSACRDCSNTARQRNHKVNIDRERAYRKNNPQISRNHMRRRRAHKLNNGVEVYTELQVLETYGTDCHICNGPVDMSAPRSTWYPGWENGLQIDHLIPISKGGPDVLSNVRPSHGKCNKSKGARLEGEF
jgi:5-methylcytosine-specific restriction endonuclease McrA